EGREVRVPALSDYILLSDIGAYRDVQYVAEEPERPLSDLERSHERDPVEMRQQIDGAHIGIDFGRSRQRRLNRGIDAREPEVGRDEELHSGQGAHILRTGWLDPCSNH